MYCCVIRFTCLYFQRFNMKLLQVLLLVVCAAEFALLVLGNTVLNDDTNIRVTEGDPLVIDCKNEAGGIVGNPEPTWWIKRNGAALPLEYPRMAVDKNGKLHIAYVKVSDGDDDMSFVCSAQSAEKKTNLIVTKATGDIPSKKPELSYSNAGKPPFPGAGLYPVNVIKGETVDLYCIFKGYPEFNITWTARMGNPLPPEGITLSDGNTKLTVDTAILPNDSLLKCTGENEEGAAESFYDVIVYGRLSITEQPKDIDMVSCDIICLECYLQYDPRVKHVVTWYRNGDIVKEYPPQIYKAPNESLIINATKYCKAEQIAGMYHYVATTTVPSQRVESTKCNVTLELDPNLNSTQAGGDDRRYWLFILIVGICVLIPCCRGRLRSCCCHGRRRLRCNKKEGEEEDSSHIKITMEKQDLDNRTPHNNLNTCTPDENHRDLSSILSTLKSWGKKFGLMDDQHSPKCIHDPMLVGEPQV